MTWIFAISAFPGRKEETVQQILNYFFLWGFITDVFSSIKDLHSEHLNVGLVLLPWMDFSAEPITKLKSFIPYSK